MDAAVQGASPCGPSAGKLQAGRWWADRDTLGTGTWYKQPACTCTCSIAEISRWENAGLPRKTRLGKRGAAKEATISPRTIDRVYRRHRIPFSSYPACESGRQNPATAKVSRCIQTRWTAHERVQSVQAAVFHRLQGEGPQSQGCRGPTCRVCLAGGAAQLGAELLWAPLTVCHYPICLAPPKPPSPPLREMGLIEAGGPQSEAFATGLTWRSRAPG